MSPSIIHLIIIGCFLVVGCGAPGWEGVRVVEGRSCVVRTNAGGDNAERLGALMDAEFRTLERLFGSRPEREVRVKAYATLRGFRRGADDGRFTRGTRGVFHAARNQISLALVRDGDYGPEAVLLHEGVHAWLHGAVGAVPWWLGEGLATCFEFGELRDGEIELGAVSTGRLDELQRLIRTKRCPPLQGVLSRTAAEGYATQDYAVAWGVTHALLRDHPEALRELLASDSKGDDAVLHFERIVIGKGKTLEQWEETWQAEMLALK